jgi:hypothetical protein
MIVLKLLKLMCKIRRKKFKKNKNFIIETEKGNFAVIQLKAFNKVRKKLIHKIK